MAGKRSIFEEVGPGAAVAAAPAGGMIGARHTGARRGIRIWLSILFLLVACMIAVGGLTRLTDSGLSITEWRPVTGALPPMNDAAWAEEFAKYQASPEYQLQNKGMDLEAFKSIYWWEWGHRQLGRVIGLVWAVGFLGFLVAPVIGRALSGLSFAKRPAGSLTRFAEALRNCQIPTGWKRRLFAVGALGGVQGAIGWWMVSSGLTGRMVDVASYRLATHLGIAFVILGMIAWYVFLLGRSETELMQARRGREARLYGMTTGLMHFAFLQILLGALVAGIDAGRAFPTWPDMNGQFFPADAFYVPDGPMWRAFFENPGLVQFIHRMSGYALFAFGVVVWLRGRQSPHRATRVAVHAVMAMLVAQVALGIYTALTAAQVHVAITHQVGAVVLWVLVIRARHLALYPQAGSIREGTA